MDPENRDVRFTTDVPAIDKTTRGVIGLAAYYMLSLILVPLMKGWTGGPAGTMISCFIRMFYISFLYPRFIQFVQETDSIIQDNQT